MEFEKYLKEGAYHWDATSISPFRHVAFTSGRYQAIMRLPLAWAGSRVLDIASGDCRLAAYVAEKGATCVVALDASRVGMCVGRDRWKLEQSAGLTNTFFVQGDATALPLRAGSFKIVLANEIIEHLDDPNQFLGAIAKMASKDGCVVVTTPVRLTDKPLDPFHVREYFPSDLELLAKKYFQDVEIILTHPAWVTSLYTLRGWAYPFRWLVNALSILGHNPFLEWPLARYAAQITMVARRPRT